MSENKHLKTYQFMKTTTVKTISNHSSSPLTKKKTPIKIKLPVLNTKVDPPPKSSYPKDQLASTTSNPPKETIKKPKIKCVFVFNLVICTKT